MFFFQSLLWPITTLVKLQRAELDLPDRCTLLDHVALDDDRLDVSKLCVEYLEYLKPCRGSRQ